MKIILKRELGGKTTVEKTTSEPTRGAPTRIRSNFFDTAIWIEEVAKSYALKQKKSILCNLLEVVQNNTPQGLTIGIKIKA